MKKFLIVALIGMVLAIDLYAFVKWITVDEVKEVDHIKETTITVYVE